MKYNCAKEFDLQIIYQKLTSKSHCTQMVKACNFFSRKDELQLLQAKMDKIMHVMKKQHQTPQWHK